MKLLATAAVAFGLLASGSAFAGATIFNTGSASTATVALGINDDGSLNTSVGNVATNSSYTGLATKIAGAWKDATSPGCLCEGWGVSVNGTVSGYANQSRGTGGLTFGALTGVTGSSATATATLTALSGVKITQTYAPSAATSALFQDTVTITNTTASTLTNVQYVRVMDWDIPPTEFSELVTIRGTATTSALVLSHDNGFCSADPLAGCSARSAGTTDVDFTDSGPADHGAYFKFNFGSLAAGESLTFNIYYGATSSETAALAAVGAAGIELYSFGQSAGNGATGSPATFIFGFSGVGGTALEPSPTGTTPEPGSIALASVALLALGGAARRRRALKA